MSTLTINEKPEVTATTSHNPSQLTHLTRERVDKKKRRKLTQFDKEKEHRLAAVKSCLTMKGRES